MRNLLRILYVRILLAVPRAAALRVVYLKNNRRFPDIKNPRRFSEKLLWRQLHDRRSMIGQSAGKLWGKERAALVSSLAVPKTIWYGTADDLRSGNHIESLPFSETTRWVLKQNNLGGGVVYFGAGRRPRVRSLHAFLNRCTKVERAFGHLNGIAWDQADGGFFIEEFIGDEVPDDYKVHVFHGRAMVISTYSGRYTDLAVRHYTNNWQALNVPIQTAHQASISRPLELPTIIRLAETLSEGFDYMRVDLYVHAGQIYFGELTPYPAMDGLAGAASLDTQLGGYWRLPVSQKRRDSAT